MSQCYDMVTLKIHLAGVIAFVAEDDTLWALMPNALLPTPARWGSLERRLPARSPHVPFLLVEENLLNKTKTGAALIDAFFRPGNGATCQAAPHPSTIAAIALLGEQLDFGTNGTKIDRDSDVDSYLPRMSVISPKHQYVSRRYHPESEDFPNHHRGLSAAFHMNTGCLTVKEFYGRPQPKDVSFAYVYSWFGRPKYFKRVWNKKVANQWTWTFHVHPDEDTGSTVTIRSKDWNFGTTSRYVLNVPDDRIIEMALMHSEVDVAALFLPDTIIPAGVEGLPDPDFEAFYGLSTRPSKLFRWRVPAPDDDSAGADEKTCSGTYFEGFR